MHTFNYWIILAVDGAKSVSLLDYFSFKLSTFNRQYNQKINLV